MSTKYKGQAFINLMPMAALLALGIDSLVNTVKTAESKHEKVKNQTQDNKATVPMFGKVIAALKKLFNQQNTLGLTFPEFYTMKTGSKKVNNHAESCAKTFALYVDNGLIEERHYDENAADNLEKAASIATLCAGDITRPEVKAAAGILSHQTKDSARQLQAIIDTLKGPKEIDGEDVKKFIALVFSNNLVGTCLACLSANITYAAEAKENRPTAMLANAYEHARMLADCCGTESERKAWAAKYEKIVADGKRFAPAQESAEEETPAEETPAQSSAPVETPAEEMPAEETPAAVVAAFDENAGRDWLKANYDGMDDETLENAIVDLNAYFDTKKALPENTEAFDAFLQEMENVPAAA